MAGGTGGHFARRQRFELEDVGLSQARNPYAQNGVWQGRQILPKMWTDAVQYPHVKDTYGYQWWVRPDGTFLADGLFSQLSFVFPRHNAVLAITAGIPEDCHFNGLVYRHFPAAFLAAAVHDSRGLTALQNRTRSLRLLPLERLTRSPVVGHVSERIIGSRTIRSR